MMLQLLSHMLYSKNNIWRVTSGCGLQHKLRQMTNELPLAHMLTFHLTDHTLRHNGSEHLVARVDKMGKKLDTGADA